MPTEAKKPSIVQRWMENHPGETLRQDGEARPGDIRRRGERARPPKQIKERASKGKE